MGNVIIFASGLNEFRNGTKINKLLLNAKKMDTMRTRAMRHSVAVGVRYAVRRLANSAEVADKWIGISVVIIAMGGMAESLPLVGFGILNLWAAQRHSNKFNGKEE